MASVRLAGVLLAALLWAHWAPAQGLEFYKRGTLEEDQLEAFIAPASPLIKNEQCRIDSLLYLAHLRNFTLWAVKMFDASAKVPVGLLAGSTFQMGHFDECLQVGSEEAPTEVVPLTAPVKAQYCLARIVIEPEHETYPGFNRIDRPHAFSLQYDPRASAWEKFMIPFDPSKKPRNSFHWATCIPSSCSAADLQTSLDAALQPLRKRHAVSLKVAVDDQLCTLAGHEPFHTSDFVVMQRYRKIEDMVLLNGTLLVDTFFVLSGFLTCFGILLEVHKKKNISVPMLYLYRWMRLTPVYMMVVAFYATLLNKVDSGPIWKARVGLEKERCVDNWWTNLLYINNYVNAERLCMFQSWYIACDMHYFLIAPLIVIPLYKKPKLGLALLGGVISLAIVIPFAVTFIGEYIGVLRVYMSLLEDPPSNKNYFAVYMKSHNRAAPYFIGMAAAYLYGILKLSDIKIPKKIMWICSLVATVLGLSSMFGAWVFYIPGREYFAFENAAYASLHRVGWALTVAWVIVGGCTTRFGILQPLLQIHAFLPLSRLTYCAFLTHGAVQLYTLATLRQPEFMSFPKLFWMASGDITISFIIALFVHLFFEAPLGGIQKMLLKKKASNRQRNNGRAPIREHTVNEQPPLSLVATPPSEDEVRDNVEICATDSGENNTVEASTTGNTIDDVPVLIEQTTV
ncbi:nose resistant to fluoxetine protein 6-like [Neocloeon triangulifer]|uniref:nose resistant to fluoxetine protein 6-like n=1 Tax=Neocloeon triangulifer TaxID=2078957 RepID=UPI00286EE3CD|nr:nose resistant to fluoxetine protein 6-like [Neocloeon triangulifer]